MAETKTKKKRGKKGDVMDRYGVSPELALDLLRDMLLYRRFEEKAEEAYAIGRIGGFCHVHIGQEGACAGSIKPLREDDYVVTAYRDHTQAIAKGVHPNAVMAELFGRVGGASGGRGGSMHVYDKSCRFMGGHGIVGGQVPLATGIAWKIRYAEEDTVAIVYMGDAAVNQGSFHESLNMAAVWELPVIYVVENNEYGMGTAFSRVSKTDMSAKPVPHGVPASVVDGQDVLATYAHFRELIAEEAVLASWTCRPTGSVVIRCPIPSPAPTARPKRSSVAKRKTTRSPSYATSSLPAATSIRPACRRWTTKRAKSRRTPPTSQRLRPYPIPRRSMSMSGPRSMSTGVSFSTAGTDDRAPR